MKFPQIAGAFLISAALQGCASNAKNIAPQYVSPLQYDNYTCPQLAREAQRVSARVAHVSGVQDKNAVNDALITTAAVIIFLPIAFAVNGDGATAAELAKLKGEFNTIEKVANRKNCGLNIRRIPTKAKKKWSAKEEEF